MARHPMDEFQDIFQIQQVTLGELPEDLSTRLRTGLNRLGWDCGRTASLELGFGHVSCARARARVDWTFRSKARIARRR